MNTTHDCTVNEPKLSPTNKSTSPDVLMFKDWNRVPPSVLETEQVTSSGSPAGSVSVMLSPGVTSWEKRMLELDESEHVIDTNSPPVGRAASSTQPEENPAWELLLSTQVAYAN